MKKYDELAGGLWKIQRYDDLPYNCWRQWWRMDMMPFLWMQVRGQMFSRVVTRDYCVEGLGAYGTVEEALADWNRAELYDLISEAYKNASLNHEAHEVDAMTVDQWTDDLRDCDADIGEYPRHFIKEVVEVWRART